MTTWKKARVMASVAARRTPPKSKAPTKLKTASKKVSPRASEEQRAAHPQDDWTPTPQHQRLMNAINKMPPTIESFRDILGSVFRWTFVAAQGDVSNDARFLDMTDVLLAVRQAAFDDAQRKSLATAVASIFGPNRRGGVGSLTDIEVTSKTTVATELVEECERYPNSLVQTTEDLARIFVAYCHPMLVRQGLTALTREAAEAKLRVTLPRLIRRRDDEKDFGAARVAITCLRAIGVPTKTADAFVRHAAHASETRKRRRS